MNIWQSKESIDAAIGDVLSKPGLPLPLGLKPPSTDSVMVELHRQGVPKIPPSCAWFPVSAQNQNPQIRRHFLQIMMIRVRSGLLICELFYLFFLFFSNWCICSCSWSKVLLLNVVVQVCLHFHLLVSLRDAKYHLTTINILCKALWVWDHK